MAVIEFLMGPLRDNPHRAGKPLVGDLDGFWSARRGAYRVVYAIDVDGEGGAGPSDRPPRRRLPPAMIRPVASHPSCSYSHPYSRFQRIWAVSARVAGDQGLQPGP